MSRPAGTAKYVRADGFEKVTGQARNAADLILPGMLERRFLLARTVLTVEGLSLMSAKALLDQSRIRRRPMSSVTWAEISAGALVMPESCGRS